MQKHRDEITWKNWIQMLAGSGLMAFAIKCIFEPSGLVTGGVTGLAIIVKHVTDAVMAGGIPLWMTNLFLNIPIFIWAFFRKGFAYIRRTLIATLSLTIWLSILPQVSVQTSDYVLGAVFGGIIGGVGLGLVLLSGATTGGTELVSSLLRDFVPYWTIPQIMLILDGIIVIVGAGVFGIQKALYAVGAIFFITKISDYLMEGWKFAKLAFVITDKEKEVAECILKSLNRGVTYLPAIGGYSGRHKNMLLCVVSKKEIVKLKQYIAEIDSHAFVIVSDIREVLGEGFVR